MNVLPPLSDEESMASSCGGHVDRSKDADHFVWQPSMILQDNPTDSKYKIVGHLGDGTFGRALKCVELTEN